jgi:alpha-amylase/alpha-mannosidase (GH57 family)
VVIHGHYYQPPRENPWLEELEAEASAAPYHDWNQRIERECYRAVCAARIPGPDGRISRIVNTLEHTSFNVGPTLFEWMEHAAPRTYAQFLEADRRSDARLGHGNAIAQPYHHVILPLSASRDRLTEIRWGIADFRRRYGRDPEGMWCPETAIDDPTLDALAAEGIRFTIVAPSQVVRAPADGSAGLYTTKNGRTIALCIYDGDISHGIAFGELIRDGDSWTRRMLETRDPARPPRLVSAATDGETYGHHHTFGEMALAHVVSDLATVRGVRVENFASYLARHPATERVEIIAPSSWSCAHGVERWRSDCGCRLRPDKSQAWRTPLRDGLAALAEGIHAIYERDASACFGDPWRVRDAFGAVLAAPPDAVAAFVEKEVGAGASPERVARACTLLEMERRVMRGFSSCAWFFDDIGGLETLQVLRHAARAIELAGPAGALLERSLLDALAEAKSNDPALGTGRDIYLQQVRPAIPQVARLAGSIAAARRVAPDDERGRRTSPAIGAACADDATAVTITHARMRESSRFLTSVIEDDARNVTVTVRPDATSGDGTITLPLPDFTEHQREAVRLQYRRTLISRCFSPTELLALSRDGLELRGRVRLAIHRAVATVARERTPEATARLEDLLDLSDLLGYKIPFDAQSEFYRLFAGRGSTPGRAAAFGSLARRLGFGADVAANG